MSDADLCIRQGYARLFANWMTDTPIIIIIRIQQAALRLLTTSNRHGASAASSHAAAPARRQMSAAHWPAFTPPLRRVAVHCARLTALLKTQMMSIGESTCVVTQRSGAPTLRWDAATAPFEPTCVVHWPLEPRAVRSQSFDASAAVWPHGACSTTVP
jgi:hypothetical protein